MKGKLVTVFGGSGFVGRNLVRALAARGARVKVAVRDVDFALFLKPMGDPGQVTPVLANIRMPASVAAAVEGADAVVNLVGILYKSGNNDFESVQADGARHVAEAAAKAGVKRLIQVSAIGADAEGESAYARTKGLGEAAARESFPGATIVRPSVIFGPDDGFFNRFGALARFSPFLPLIGGGHTRFQPVYVGDVALALVAAIEDPAAVGQTYELGGPTTYTFRELMEHVLKITGLKRVLLPLPFAIAKLDAAFLQLLPKPPLTIDQVKLLARDNVVSPGAKTLADLGIAQPTPLEAVSPYVLRRYRKGSYFTPTIQLPA